VIHSRIKAELKPLSARTVLTWREKCEHEETILLSSNNATRVCHKYHAYFHKLTLNEKDYRRTSLEIPTLSTGTLLRVLKYRLLSTNYTRKLVLTTSEQTNLNRCQPLRAPYKRLLNRKQWHTVYYSSCNPSIYITSPHTSSQSSHHVFTNGCSNYSPIKSLTRVFEFSTD